MIRAHSLLALLLLLFGGTATAADGDPDTTFSADGKASYQWPAPATIQSETLAVATAPDGQVVVGGWLSYSDNGQQYAATVVRFRHDGAIDTTFGDQGAVRLRFSTATGVRQAALALRVQSDGKILVFGRVGTAGGPAPDRPVMARLMTDGQPDTSFGPLGIRPLILTTLPSGAELTITAAAWQADGKLVAAVSCLGCGPDSTDYDFATLRALPDGSADPTFGSSGLSRFNASGLQFATALAIDDVGRLVIAGSFATAGPATPFAVRLAANGAPDSTFNGGDLLLLPCLNPGATQCNVAAVAAGRTLGTFFARRLFFASNGNGSRSGILALNTDGTLATSFANDGFLDLTLEDGTSLRALAFDAQARLLAVGWIDPDGGGSGSDFFGARATFGGDLDNTFSGNGVARYAFDIGGLSFDSARAVTFSDGRPVVAGLVHNNTLSRYHTGVLRLQEDRIFAAAFQ